MSNLPATQTTETPTEAFQVAASRAPIASPDKPLPLAFTEGKGIVLTSTDEMMRFARAVVASGLAPKGFEKPEAVFIAVQAGAEIGLSPWAALSNIAVINGRPGLFGDAPLAVVRGSGLLEDYGEAQIGEPGTDSHGFKVTIKRKGNTTPIVRQFTVSDAKRAGLWGKSGPWSQYPDRMLNIRARAFALRDGFADVLKGCAVAEEQRDIPAAPKNVTKSLAEELA